MEIDYKKFFSFHIIFFKILGFWKPDPNTKYKHFYILYTLLCTIILILFLLSECIYIYKNLDNVAEFTAVSYIGVVLIVDLIKMFVIYKNMDVIKSLLGKLNQPMFQPVSKKHYQIAMATKRFHRNTFYLCLYLGLQCYFFFLIVTHLKEKKIIPTPAWFPFEYDHFPNYEIVYLFQNYAVLWNDLICLNLDTFSAGFLMQIGMQCDFLCETLNNLHMYEVKNGILVNKEEVNKVRVSGSEFSKTMMENLVVCIQHHREIKRFAEKIEDIHKTSVFILFLVGGLIVCSGLFQLTTSKIGSVESFMLIFYIVCALTDQFIYCWFGNKVIEKSGNILNSAYNTPWLKCDIKFQKTLLQFITLTKYPIRITVGGLWLMSNDIFVSVVKSSYSILTLLQKIQKPVDIN